MQKNFASATVGLWARRANNPEGEVVVNDSPVDCQSHRTDRSIFSAEKIQDRWFKSFLRNLTKDTQESVFFVWLRGVRPALREASGGGRG